MIFVFSREQVSGSAVQNAATQALANSIGNFHSGRRATEIACVQFGVGSDAFNYLHQSFGGFSLAKMLKHHDR